MNRRLGPFVAAPVVALVIALIAHAAGWDPWTRRAVTAAVGIAFLLVVAQRLMNGGGVRAHPPTPNGDPQRRSVDVDDSSAPDDQAIPPSALLDGLRGSVHLSPVYGAPDELLTDEAPLDRDALFPYWWLRRPVRTDDHIRTSDAIDLSPVSVVRVTSEAQRRHVELLKPMRVRAYFVDDNGGGEDSEEQLPAGMEN